MTQLMDGPARDIAPHEPTHGRARPRYTTASRGSWTGLSGVCYCVTQQKSRVACQTSVDSSITIRKPMPRYSIDLQNSKIQWTHHHHAGNAWECVVEAQRHIRVFQNTSLTFIAAAAHHAYYSTTNPLVKPPTAMFVKNSPRLNKTVKHILAIYDQRVVSTQHLTTPERLESWREALKAIREELESVRPIINETDDVPHMLIGVDKFLHWSEKLGTRGNPFPQWNDAIFPKIDLIAGHPWLLPVKERPNASHEGAVAKPIDPASNSSGMSSITGNKGKYVETLSRKQVAVDRPSKAAVEDDGESEVEEEVDELMEEDEDVNQTRGRSNKRGRAQGTPSRSSARASSRSRARKVITDAESSPKVGRSSRQTSDAAVDSKYGRAQMAARTTPPPNPKSCGTCISRKVVCTRSMKEGACDPCKQRKIACTQATRRRAPSTTRRSKAAPTANTPRRRNPSRARKTPRRRDESPSTEPEDAEEPPARKKRRTSPIDDTPRPSPSSRAKPRTQPFSIVIPAPKRAASYAIPPSHPAEPSATTPARAASRDKQMPASAPTPEWLPPAAAPSIPELLTRVDAMTDRQDVILARVNELERRIMGLDTQRQAPTPGLADDRIRMLEGELAEFQWTVGTLTREVEALRLKVQDITTPDIQEATILTPTPAIEPAEDAIAAAHGDQESTIVTAPEGSAPSDKPATTPTATATSQDPAPAIEPSEAVSTAEMDISSSNVESSAQLDVGDGNVTLDQSTGEVAMAAEQVQPFSEPLIFNASPALQFHPKYPRRRWPLHSLPRYPTRNYKLG
ncbi:hypothetical protein EDD15DRAFT_2193838 [Pisolithus albus]|nr:hypothetical protein EDD15DRAFT_2193838 [Pisolithus albus]